MIKLDIPGVPPTDNHAYINLPRGGRTLSTDGRKYKNETINYLSRTYPTELNGMSPDKKYLVWFTMYFKKLEYKSAHKKTKSRYKRLDVGNRRKLLEDAIATVTGVDDANSFVIVLSKREGKEKTVVRIWDMDEAVVVVKKRA